MALQVNRKKITLNNILWATDFSASSEIALPSVLGLARRYGSKVYMTHVVPTDPASILRRRANGDHFEECRRHAEEIVTDLRSAGRLNGLRLLVLIREGKIGETLCSTVRDYDIDLMVIGARPRAGMKKLFMGAVTEEVVRRAPCQVLIMGARCSGEFAQNTAFSHVICATDLSSGSRAVSDYALSLARDHQSQCTLLHIPERITAETQDRKALLIEIFRRQLEELVPDEVKGREVKLSVEFGTPATRILTVAEEERADLIILGTRHADVPVERWPGPTANSVIPNASCPVLTVPILLGGPAVSDLVRNWKGRIAA